MAGSGPKLKEAHSHRRRYEQLRAAGQGTALAGLPQATPLGAAPIAPEAVLHTEDVPGGWYATIRLRRNEMLRIIDIAGTASPALVVWRAEDTTERINLADTLKIQWSATLRRGCGIYSDMGRILLSIVEDTSGAHDALMGGTAPGPGESYRRTTRENLIAAAAKLGLDRRDIPACLSLFAPVSVDAESRFKWNRAQKRPGDFVDLRAEIDLLVAISNCAHPLSPRTSTSPGVIKIVQHAARSYGGADPCRRGTPEMQRAYDFTDRLVRA